MEDNNSTNNSASPITGAVIGTNNRERMLARLVRFIGDLFN